MTDETTPAEPVDPDASVRPVEPVPTPYAPEWSAEPLDSDAPVQPIEPLEPIEPIEPASTTYAPVEPTVPLEPASTTYAPVVPVVPVEPVVPLEPVPTPPPAVVPPASPALGPTISSGSRVVVMVSRGPSPTPPIAYVTVPQVVGMAQGDALARLQEAGLPSQVFNDYNERLPRGEVIGQLPAQGASVPSGAESVLMVSSGRAAAPTIATALPNVIGLAESDAVSRIQAAGLSPQLVREYSPNIPDGVVIAQLPNSASLVEMPKKRSLAWLWIVLAVLVVAALGVGGYLYLNRTGVVPSVVGLSQADATTALKAAGFKIETIEMTQSIKASEVGKVVGQKPAANTESKMSAGVVISVSGGQKLLEVPTITGKTQAEAESALKKAGLTASVTKGYSGTVAKGVVISQAPEAGQKVPSETSVGMVISEGAQNVTVPGLSGQSQSAATTSLKSLGLSPQVVSNYDQSTSKGQVAEQFPAAGTAVPPGTIVGLVVSLGSATSTPTVTVPVAVGKTSSQAETALKAVGLKPVAVQWSGTGRPANEVVGQVPDSNALVWKGASVLIFVSNGK